MSRTFQKFELLNLKGSIEHESFKIIRVDDISNSKEILQNTINLLHSGRIATDNQILDGIDVIQDIKSREGIEISVSGQTLIEDQWINSTEKPAIHDNDKEIQRLLDSKLSSVNLLIKPGCKDAHKKLLNSYCSLIILAQLIVSDGEFREVIEEFFNLLRDIFQESNRFNHNKVSSINRMPSKDTEIYQNKEGKKMIGDYCSQTSYKDFRRIEKLNQGLINEKMNMSIRNMNQTTKSFSNQSNKDIVKRNKCKGQEITNYTKNPITEALSNNKIQAQSKHKTSNSIDSINQFTSNDDRLKILAHRLAGSIHKVQSCPEYQNALEGFFDLLSNIKQNYETATNDTIFQVKIYNELAEAVDNAKKAVENFANHYCLDTMINLIKEFNFCVESDRKLQKVMKSNYQFILNIFKDKKFFYDSKFNENTIDQFNLSHYLLKACGEHIKRILTEGTQFFWALKEDNTDIHTISDLESLTKELFLDDTGGPTIKYDLLQNIHKFVPVLAQRLKQLEIPRITGEVDGFEYILDNISFCCGNILPRTVHVHTDTDFDTKQDKIMNVISVKVQDIQVAAQNITFYYKKKSILGSIEDAGIVHITIDKGGLDVFFKFSPGSTSNLLPCNQPNFNVLDSQCRVNDISIKFQQGKYDLMYRLFNKTLKNTIKRHIENLVSKRIREFLEESNIHSQQNSQIDLLDQLAKSLNPNAWRKPSVCSSI